MTDIATLHAEFQACRKMLEEFSRRLAGLPIRPRKPVESAAVLQLVADQFSTTVDAIASESRVRCLADARAIAAYLMRSFSTLTLEEIGKQLGGRDRTTAIYLVSKVSSERARNPVMERIVGEMECLLLQQEENDDPA